MREDSTSVEERAIPGFEDLEQWIRFRVQELLQAILEEEVEVLLGRGRYERHIGVDGACGYRNGYGQPRRLSLQGGTVVVRRPRVRGLEERFESRVLPLFQRRTKEVGQLLPELYLHGLAQGDFELALRGLLGDGASLSANSIGRLKAKWEMGHEAWSKRDLSHLEVVYFWADGLYVKAGIGKDKAALLVVMGALRDGRKELLALESGYRESKGSWAGVLRSLKQRGLRAPKLTIADGHLGIWGALVEIYPESEEQRCWNHKILNALDQLPRKIQGQAKELLCGMPYAESRQRCEQLRVEFNRRFADQYPKAVQVLERDWERMVTFYGFPKEHWKHIRTTNVVESPFSSVRLRTNAARRYKKVNNATALIWKVLMVAQRRFRRLDAPHLLADIFEGVRFTDGNRISVPNQEVAA
jgi:putative transposase